MVSDVTEIVVFILIISKTNFRNNKENIRLKLCFRLKACKFKAYN